MAYKNEKYSVEKTKDLLISEKLPEKFRLNARKISEKQNS